MSVLIVPFVLLFSVLYPSGLSAQATNLFHSGFEDSIPDTDLSDGSSGSLTDDPWSGGGYRGGADVLEGVYTTDVLSESRSCRLTKSKGTDSLYTNVVLPGSEYDEMAVGMWFKLDDWEQYDVPPGASTDLFSIWNGGKTERAVRVMVSGDRQRSLQVEYDAAGGPVALGTPAVDPDLAAGALAGAGPAGGSVYLDSRRWYYLELFFRSDSTSGGVELRVDGGARLYRFGDDTSGRKAGALILGSKAYEDSRSAMTLLFDDVDIWDRENWMDALGAIHGTTHRGHVAGIPLTVDYGTRWGNFEAGFQRPFLQMVAEPEGDLLYLARRHEKYRSMGMRGVRFVASGNECHYGNPQVTGKPGVFQYDFSHLDSLVVGVTSENDTVGMGASLRLGMGKTNTVMQCLECFEYPGPESLASHWQSTDPAALPIALTALAYERSKGLKIAMTAASGDTVWHGFGPVDPDSDWSRGTDGVFDLWIGANRPGASCRFFLLADSDTGADSALWVLDALASSGGYGRVTVDLSSPDSHSTHWTHSSLARVRKFGLYDFSAGGYPVRFLVDWMRLPGTNWFPYDGSRYALEADWWASYCGALVRHVYDNYDKYVTDGLVIEGWNESDRMYTMSGNPALESIVLDLYRVMADTFAAYFDTLPEVQMASLGFTNPKETGLIRDYLEEVRDRSLAMDLFTTHSYTGSPQTVLDIARWTRSAVDTVLGGAFAGTPLYLGAYMDFFVQDFRKDTSHRAAQWLMTMLDLEQANREDSLGVWGVATYGYKDFNASEVGPPCDWPFNDNRRFFGAFGLLTNLQFWGGERKALANVYEMVSVMDTVQVSLVDGTVDHPERQVWVKGIATKAGTEPAYDDTVSLLLVNFDNAQAVGRRFSETVEAKFRNLPSTWTSVHWKQYRIDQRTSSRCFDGGWCELIGSNPYVIRDITGTKDWAGDALNGLSFVDEGSSVFAISDTYNGNTLELTETTPELVPGTYHVENATDTLAVVADTTVTVQGDSLLRAVEMPLNSVVLIQIYP